jgi:hypothetical protein
LATNCKEKIFFNKIMPAVCFNLPANKDLPGMYHVPDNNGSQDVMSI